jgi:hypothetical protein
MWVNRHSADKFRDGVDAVSAIFGIGSANAADLPARTYTEAPPPLVAAYNWTGCF